MNYQYFGTEQILNHIILIHFSTYFKSFTLYKPKTSSTADGMPMDEQKIIMQLRTSWTIEIRSLRFQNSHDLFITTVHKVFRLIRFFMEIPCYDCARQCKINLQVRMLNWNFFGLKRIRTNCRVNSSNVATFKNFDAKQKLF